MIADSFRLSVYFGDSAMTGQAFASEVLMECFRRREVRVAALFRGVEGFGINRRIQAETVADMSTDLPLLAVAVDTRERIEDLLGEVDGIIPRGLVTLEEARLAIGDDVAQASFPDGPGRAAKLTIYCGRSERTNGTLAFREAVDLLRRCGAAGAIVLLGVDGVLRGERQKARLFAANVDTPLMIISVGSATTLARALPGLRDCLAEPVVTLEGIAQIKHDGELLEPPPAVSSPLGDDVWHTLRVYTRRSAQVNGRPLYSELTRQLRSVGAAGVTTILGDWGFSSDERPSGDRFGRLLSHTPSYTVYIDRPQKVAEVWPVVDEITAQHGIVTSLIVPGYRERAGDTVHGELRTERLLAPNRSDLGPVELRTRPDDPQWLARFAADVEAFARERGLPEALVRVTLADGDRFFLASLSAAPGDGFITLYPHPERYDEMVPTIGGGTAPPRAVIVPMASVVKFELLSRAPRGTRSLVGFRMRT